MIVKRDSNLCDGDGSKVEMILYASGKIVIRGQKKVQDWLARTKKKEFEKELALTSVSHADKTRRSKQKKNQYYFQIWENRESSKGYKLTLLAESRKIRGEWIQAISGIVSSFRKSQEPLVINLQRVLGVPNDNKDDPADCFVTIQLSCSDREIRWPCVKDSKNPVWQLPMEVYPVEPPKDVKLTIKLYDRNLLRHHDLLGITQTRLQTLEMDTDVLLPFRLEDIALESKKRAGEEDMICAVVLRRVDTRKCPKRKLLFLIRHGESEWNRAERKGVMSVMHEIQSVDHPLSELGISQALSLRERLASGRKRRRRHGKTYASIGVGVDGDIVEGMQDDIRNCLERVLTMTSSKSSEDLLYCTVKRWQGKSRALKRVCELYEAKKEAKDWIKRLRDALGVTLLGINEAEEFGCFRFHEEVENGVEKEEVENEVEKEEDGNEKKEEQKMEQKEKAALKIQTKWREKKQGKSPTSPPHSPPHSPSSPLNEPKRDRSSSFVPRQMLRIFDKALIAGDIDLYRSIQSEMRNRSSKPLGDENETPVHFRDFLEDELVFKMFEECSSIIMSPLCRAVRIVRA